MGAKKSRFFLWGKRSASLPKVKDLRARVAALSGGAAEHRDAVFSHLLTFFSRYYDRGDFISQRRYKGDSQDVLNTRARDTVLADPTVKAHWLDLARRQPTEKNPQRTLLDKQLGDYTAKNKADYFIHKDLGGFLRRELDFYIKNEVMHLDDVQNAAAFADIEKSLRLIQCLRAIALDLVAFLAQLEDFQKKLWLKKKFVVEAHYCLTLDRIYKIGDDLKPKDSTRAGVLAEREWLLAQIAANEKQIAAWIDLGLVKNAACEPVLASTDPLFAAQATTVAERLRAHPFLMVDTQLFSTEFKYRLLSQLHDLDAQCDGLLVHSENFQALRLLQERYRGEVKCTYIDPPYNTGGDGFLYRDSLRCSSWLSFGLDRILSAQSLISADGVTFCSIDENQVDTLSVALGHAGGGHKLLTPFVWKRKAGGGDDSDYIAAEHEYVLCLAKEAGATRLGKIEHESEAMTAKYNRSENERRYYLERLDKTSLTYSAEMDFDIECPDGQKIEPPQPNPNNPTTIWRWSKTKIKTDWNQLIFEREKKTNEWRIYTRTWESLDGVTPRSLLVDKHHGRNRDGTQEIGHLLGSKAFSNPKPLRLLAHLLAVGAPEKTATILDFFAGSGTTAHAVINRNREDSGRRKYILIEVGGHFDSVLRPRVQKAVYSKTWENVVPVGTDAGLSHCFKYLRLESYEDTLNNLALKRPDGLTDLFDPAGKEDYLLHYMLNVESQASLLSVEDFKKPFDYKLRIAADSAGTCRTRAVDLVETFNYLLGLRIAHLDAKLDLGHVLVSGKLPDGQSCLIIWRDCEKLDYEGTTKLLERHKITPNDNEYDVVYINGDHNIPTIAQATEAEGGVTRQLTLRQIEPEFIARMFAGEEV